MSVQDVLERGGPRKLLALDGGGTRGLMTVEVLAAIEEQLQGARGDAERTAKWLGRHGLGSIDPRDVQRLDSTSHMDALQEVGRKVALQVKPMHFAGFVTSVSSRTLSILG